MSEVNLFGELQSEPPPAPRVKKPNPDKARVRGVVKINIAGEDYKVEMRTSGITVRRCRKKHVSHKSLQDILDFVTGQKQLDFNSAQQVMDVVSGMPKSPYADMPLTPLSDYTELLEYCIEYIATNIAYGNDPKKFATRLQFAAAAIQGKVDELMPNKVAERLGKITT